MSAALEAAGLTLGYGDRLILDDVDLTLRSGEAVALIGGNGAGKTTLLRALAGVASLGRGRVTVGELDTAHADRRALARRVGLATQHAELHVPLRAWDVAALGLYAHGASWRALDEAERARVGEALEAFGVLACAERAMPSLSGGEQQRVRLAALRVQAPPVLLLDEPTSAQDLDGTVKVAAWMREHCADGGAVLAAVHDLGLALRGFDRVVVLGGGRLLADGPPAEVATSAALREAYGRAPEVLCDALGDLWVAPPLAHK